MDTRNGPLTLKCQEILTADKVAVRISILIHYRVTDIEAALHKVESYEDRIYEDVQLSARRFLSEKALDEILQDRNEISDFAETTGQFSWRKETYFGCLFQKIVAQRQGE